MPLKIRRRAPRCPDGKSREDDSTRSIRRMCPETGPSWGTLMPLADAPAREIGDELRGAVQALTTPSGSIPRSNRKAALEPYAQNLAPRRNRRGAEVGAFMLLSPCRP